MKNALRETEAFKDWWRLGRELGFSKNAMNKILMRYRSNMLGAKVKLFTMWTENNDSASMAKLVEALTTTGHTSLADDIRDKYNCE